MTSNEKKAYEGENFSKEILQEKKNGDRFREVNRGQKF